MAGPTPAAAPPPRRGGGLAVVRAQARRLAVLPPPPGLSRREVEVLPWLATDLSYAAIARELGCSLSNTRQLVRRVCGRLGVVTRSAAVARWLRPEAFAGPEAAWPKGQIDGRATTLR